MLYEKNVSKELSKELFQNPSVEYRGVPFWSWNCMVTKELIDEQLEIFRQMGFGGVNIHARIGLETEYLSEEYMELVAYTVKKCKELGLLCWLYDEDRFPSGSAGGIVTKNFRFRGRYLLLTEKKQRSEDGVYPDRKSFEEAINRGEKPTGYYVTTYVLNFQEGYLQSYKRIEQEEKIQGASSEHQKIRYAYVKVVEEDPWFENQTNVEYLNPEAIAEFINVTHERYKKYVGEEFGKVVPAIFTDEPRVGKHGRISCALSAEDVTMPYSDFLVDLMKEKYEIELLDVAPEYIWELPKGFSVNRYRYRDAVTEAFVSAYMDQICDWCAEQGIAMAGHVLGEETLSSQTHLLGECMRCYRKMDIPGIDILVDGREFANAKQAVSVSRQNGKEGTLSELYGSTDWDCDFKTYKLQGDWQAALGITIRVPHLSHMSLQGEAKRDWPASIFNQSPWYKEYASVENYFSRLHTVLTRGKARVNIGVIHPVESMWMLFGPVDQTEEKRKELERSFKAIVDWLLYGTLDFDFLSESLLPEQCKNTFDCADKKFCVGEMQYQAVLVPNMLTIRSTTLELLEKFHAAGGQIIFMGQVPNLVDGSRSDRAEKLAAQCTCIGLEKEQLYDKLEEVREVKILDTNQRLSDNLFYQLREDGKYRWLFICHVNHKTEGALAKETYRIFVRGNYRVTLYDTRTGENVPTEVTYVNGNTEIKCTMYAEDSVLYHLDEVTDVCEAVWKESEKKTEKYRTIVQLKETKSSHRQEWNALLLDYAGYQLRDGEIHAKEEILRLDNTIREQLGFELRMDRMCQPWFLEEKEHHQLTLYYEFDSEIRTEGYLAIEHPENCYIRLNEEEVNCEVTGYFMDNAISVVALPEIKEGKNKLKITVDYHQKTNLERLYILGDFDVELSCTEAIIRKKRLSVSYGDITEQGMPFYTGNLEYVFCFEVPEKQEYYVQIPEFKAPVLSVSVDGEKKGLMAYAPHRQSLGVLEKGQHELTVCLYGNRFNSLGALHNAVDNYVWCGPDCHRTKGDAWTEEYRVRPVGIFSPVELQVKE